MNVKAITGVMSATSADATVAPLGPPQTYFGVAQQLLPAIATLSNPPASVWALALLCGHTLECLLKAYLSRGGSDTHLQQPQIRHNLEGLWRQAASEGLPIPADPPDWAGRLSALHNKPYYLRYSIGVNGIVTPPPGLMASELAELLELVRTRLH